MKEVYVITDHKPLVLMVNKDVAMPSQSFNVSIQHVHLIQAWPEFFIVSCLSHHNQAENRDQEITGMNINIHTISTKITICIARRGHNSNNELGCQTANAQTVHSWMVAIYQ